MRLLNANYFGIIFFRLLEEASFPHIGHLVSKFADGDMKIQVQYVPLLIEPQQLKFHM